MHTHEDILKEWNGASFLAKERNQTIAFLRSKYGVTKDDAEDVFQESAMALFLHIKEDKLELEKTSLSSYFKRICILQTLKFLRDNKGRHDDIYVKEDNGKRFTRNVEKVLEEMQRLNENKYDRDKTLMWMLVARMPSPCKEILWGFYHEEKKLDEIALEMGKDKALVKVRKSQCLNKLKKQKHLLV